MILTLKNRIICHGVASPADQKAKEAHRRRRMEQQEQRLRGGRRKP